MRIELTMLGGSVYGAMLAYGGSCLALACRSKRLGGALHAVGFVLAASAFVGRWVSVGHLPVDNLFGVFLCLGMLSWPLAALCRCLLGVSSGPEDPLIGVVLLFPVGFVISSEPRLLPPALQSPLFGPHVLAYLLAYVVLFKAGVEACRDLLHGAPRGGDQQASHEASTFRLVRLGFPLLTLGLVLGAVWGKRAWGDYWNWDPKELWSLAMWLVYLAYFQVRNVFGAHRRVNSVLALGGVCVIVVTLLWVNLGRIFVGLHSYAT